MHGWLQYELGSPVLRIKNQKVVSVQHIPGARDVLRMETVEETAEHKTVGNSMSGTLKNLLTEALNIDEHVVQELYGITKEQIKLFVPIECPKMCLTKNGVLRPWTLDVNLGKDQAAALQRLLRREFWNAVAEYDEIYAANRGNKRYAAKSMIEDFCAVTETPDLYVEAMRREWQRRVKRQKEQKDTKTTS